LEDYETAITLIVLSNDLERVGVRLDALNTTIQATPVLDRAGLFIPETQWSGI
jgi:hypothetical protein